MTNSGSVWAVIPARYASSRYPGKPLARILGIPLVVRVYGRVAAAFPSDRIAVATDDVRIRDVCAAEGITTVMTSSDCLTGTDRVWEAAEQLNADVVINVQGDEPMIRPADITTVLAAKAEHPRCVINAMCPITSPEEIASSNVPKVVTNKSGELAYISRAPIPFVKDPRYVPTYYRQVCIYAFSRSELKAFAGHEGKSRLEGPEDIEILRFVDLGIPIRMVEVSAHTIAVDEPADVARVERLLSQNES
jgi:3-deoxy-manno-octulosonate cytidylyltransferase (CMP-KDO synthetase)